MRTKKRVLPALVFSLFAAFGSAEAQSAQFSNVYVFGDSLSDAGYYRGYLRAVGLPQATVDAMGRFSTNPGPVWSELVATYYGITPRPSNVSGGTIYAQGGARVALTPGTTPTGFAERPVSTQVTEFLAATGGAADPRALYAVWAGANDVFAQFNAILAGQITQAQLTTNVQAAAGAEIQQIARLRAAGARYIMVFGLPDMGTTPGAASLGAATAGLVSQVATGYNTALFTGLASAGIRVITVDTFSMVAEMRANPASFGLSNVTGIACGPFPPFTAATSITSLFCNPSNTVAGGADTYLYSDPTGHPTSAAHRIIAQFAEALIEGPSNYGLLAEAALRSRQSHIRSVSDGVLSARSNEVGGWDVFGGADRGTFDIQAGGGFGGLNSRARSGTIGITARVSEAVTVGAAFGSSKDKGTFNGGFGNFTVDENIWSLFASAKWGGFYATGVVSIADLQFNDMKRNIVLGTGLRTATANTEGSNSSAQFNLGYDLTFGRLTIGPTVSVTSQNVDVNGFDEAGAGAANLRLMTQKRKSEVWSGGVRASYALGRWTPWAKFTADKERRDDERLVTAVPLTMASIGNTYDVPTYMPDTSFTTVSLGINGTITDRIGVSLAAFKVGSRAGIKESGVNGMVSVKF